MRIALVFSVLVALVTGPARAADPTFVIHHQGRLLGADDKPLTGALTLTARLWSSSTEAEPVWLETYDVVVDGAGLYAIALGDTAGEKAALSASDFAGARWFSISIDDVELLPRQRLGGTAYAFEAAHATAADEAIEAHNALSLGDAPAADYLKRADFDALKAAVTVTEGASTTVPWSALSGVPASLNTALQSVAITGGALSGDGTEASPLTLAPASIATAHLQDQSVTREKLETCDAGEILKVVGGVWSCAPDIGSGNTLPFALEAPLAQVAGDTGALLRLEDGGIGNLKLADDSVDARKLGADAASLGKMTGNVLVATGDGALGVGQSAPTARVDITAFDPAGLAGPGHVDYVSGSLTVIHTGGDFADTVRPGDSVRLGGLDWRTVTAVPDAGTLTLSAGFPSAFSGTWRYRRATLRAGDLVQTATGELGVGIAAPASKLHVAGDVRAEGDVRADGDMDVTGTYRVNGVSAVVPPGAVMHFATPTCPDGWLAANGQTVSAADHPALAAAMGVFDDFAVPDLRGEFVRGLDDGRGVDSGRQSGSWQAQDFKSFSAWNTGPGSYSHGPVAFSKTARSGNLFGGYWSSPAGRISIDWDGSEVRPRNVALLACIKR